MPIFHYDHIVDFAEVPVHDPSNLALLCPHHHNEKTANRLSRARVEEARRSPFNATRDKTGAYRWEPSRKLEVWIGSNQAHLAGTVDEYPVLWINGQEFVTIHRDGDFFSFSATVTDEAGQVLLAIQRGELTVATDVWDYRYEGRNLSIRRGQGEIILEAEIADNAMRIRRGAFVDRFATGIAVSADGAVTFTMSGLHIGELRESPLNGPIGIGIVRQSCFQGRTPSGGSFCMIWKAEYEDRAEELRKRMLSGVPGTYPKGLTAFRRYSDPVA